MRLQVYSGPQHAGAFDCVATCFFIDTAHNIIDYLHVIRHVLKASTEPGCAVDH
jgi:carnosine N-methyltransferase